jgi:hypothetical protein
MMKMGTKESAVLAAIVLWQWIVATAVHASEWKGKCGISKSTITTCTFIKGDGALGGETGTSYTYALPSGDRFQGTSKYCQ